MGPSFSFLPFKHAIVCGGPLPWRIVHLHTFIAHLYWDSHSQACLLLLCFFLAPFWATPIFLPLIVGFSTTLGVRSALPLLYQHAFACAYLLRAHRLQRLSLRWLRNVYSPLNAALPAILVRAGFTIHTTTTLQNTYLAGASCAWAEPSGIAWDGFGTGEQEPHGRVPTLNGITIPHLPPFLPFRLPIPPSLPH